jgi:hypothetical protein
VTTGDRQYGLETPCSRILHMDELTDGMTLAITAPSAYTRYTFIFYSTAYVSLGCSSWVAPDATVPDGLFFQPPAWKTRGPNVLEPDAPVRLQADDGRRIRHEVPVASWSHTTGGYVAGRRGVSTLDVTGDRDKAAASFERSSEDTTFLVPYSVTAAGSGHCR